MSLIIFEVYKFGTWNQDLFDGYDELSALKKEDICRGRILL